jgi:hypothetical protein
MSSESIAFAAAYAVGTAEKSAQAGLIRTG